MRPPRAGQPIKPVVIASAALLGLAAASPAAARGGYHHAEAPPPPCGFVGGALAEPAETHRCLAERYRAAKAKSGATPAAAPTNATSRTNAAAPAR